MAILIVLGVVWSISNFFSIELRAGGGMKGVWTDGDCMGKGDECDITASSTEH